MDPRQPFDLGQERRLRVARPATERALERRAQVGQSNLSLRRAPLARRRGQIAIAVQRHRDAEQALDHALVNLAREIDPVLELVCFLSLIGHDSRHRHERGRFAQRPQQIALGVVDRWRRHQPVGEDHADRAAGRGHRSADEPHRLGEQLRVFGRKLVGHVANRLDHPILGQRLNRHRRGLDRDVGFGELFDLERLRARGANATRRAVVAEDDCSAHPRQPTHRGAEPVVEALAGRRCLL